MARLETALPSSVAGSTAEGGGGLQTKAPTYWVGEGGAGGGGGPAGGGGGVQGGGGLAGLT